MPQDPRDPFTTEPGAPAATMRLPDASSPGSTDAALAIVARESRYEHRALLGHGGMGEVHLCTDRAIGRDVAMKLLRHEARPGGAAHARFVREALVQARLEHPAIVPVYDVAIREDGATWFTMKRVRGRTLEKVIAALRARDPEITREHGRRRLLVAFVQLCLAVDYAHQQGVVHRDLKPANVMLGDFGEIHVLDWGIAKVIGATDRRLQDLAAGDHERTLAGAPMGTPGYMSPEQAIGDQEHVDARSDVYSLGAILFEMLAREPLHRGTSASALLASTTSGVDARPSARGHDVPPELDAVCVRATARKPSERFASARELAREIERFLDGDRDLAQRRDLAGKHLERARTRLASGARDEGSVAANLQDLGRAVALDPTQPDALALLAHAIVEAPSEVSPAARAELEAMRASSRRAAARHAATRFVIWGLMFPLVFWMGIRDWPVTIGLSIFIACSGAITFLMAQREHHARLGATLLVASSLVVMAAAALFGPFVMVPGLAATNAMYFAMTAEPKHRPAAMIAGVITVLVPFALEALGLAPPSYAFVDRGFVVLERATYFPALPTTLVLLFSSVAMIVIPTSLVGRMRDALFALEEKVFLQAWHLRRMLPKEAHAALRQSMAPG